MPDVPICETASSKTSRDPKGSDDTKKSNSRPGFVLNSRKLSTEKSVTWKDDRVSKRSERKLSKMGSSTEVHGLDELVTVLSELCNALEHNSLLMKAYRPNEGASDVFPCESVPPNGKHSELGKRLTVNQRDLQQLSIRTEKVRKCGHQGVGFLCTIFH